MKKVSAVHLSLALVAMTVATTGLSHAVSIYVNDNWGPTPTRSAATTPVEDAVETRIHFNPHTNAFSTTAFPDDGNLANGIDSVITGLENIEYFPLAGAYNVVVPASFTDPTDGSTVNGAVLGVNAFGTMRDAIAAIGAGTATPGTDTIVVLAGTYYEAIMFPQNNLNNATVNAYYTPLTNTAFFTKMRDNFTIIGDPLNKPTFTRGASFVNETTDGFTLENIRLAGVPGTNGNGVNSTSAVILAMTGGNTAFVDPGTASNSVGYRKDLSIVNCVFDGLKNRLPFAQKQPLNLTAFPTYTTLPAQNNIVSTSGGRGGTILRGERGTINIIGNEFVGIRSFWTFDSNRSTNGDSTWTTMNIEQNTIIDTWGNFAIRGEDPGATGTQPTAGYSATANVVSNTVRNMGEQVLEVYKINAGAYVKADPAVDPAPYAYLADHAPNSGAAFKLFNVRNVNFTNNTITRVNIMQDWFTKPNATKVPPGVAGFIPMGAGMLIRDFRRSDVPIVPNWTGVDRTTASIRGNLFDSCQQGIAIDPPAAQKYIPAGIVEGNTFINNRTGIYLFDSVITSISWTVVDNVFTSPSDDPLGTGIGAGAGTDVLAGIAFGNNAGTAPEVPAPSLDVQGNFFGDVSGPGGIGGGTGAAIIVPASAPTFNITAITAAANPQVTTSVNHPFSVGMNVTITGSLRADLNGNSYDVLTTPGGTTFTLNVGVPGSLVGAGGTVSGSSTVTAGGIIGEAPGQFDTVYPNLDTDGDGISDVAEGVLGTNPNNADSDGDGIPDGTELRIGSLPLNANSPISGGLTAANDPDGDRIPSSVEAIIGTDPNNADSDADGLRDDYELLTGSDPSDILSISNFGEANGNGVINVSDAIRILEAFLNLNTLNETDRDRVDINRDGNVTAIDATFLYQRLQGNIPYIPFP